MSGPGGMALLYRFVKINDRCNSQVFTFIVTKSVVRDFHRDVTTKDFTYSCQKWAVTFNRADKYLGAFLAWRNPCVGMRCYVDFAFSILNRGHFSQNEVFSAKQCRFTVDQTANGNRKLITVADLPARNFVDENGEFLLEVTLSNVHNIFESELRVPHPVPTAQKGGARLETNYFRFGHFEWNVAVAAARDGRMLVHLNRLTGFDHQCRVRYRVVLGEGDRRCDSGVVDEFSDVEGRGYGWPLKSCQLAELSRRGVVRVYVEMVIAHAISEVKLCPASGLGGACSAQCYDREKHAWSVEADANTELLRLKLMYKDVGAVPPNHLRYVTWSANVLRRPPPPGGGGREPVPVLNTPLSKYYVQEESDEGVLMETGIPMREITDPCLRYLETNNQIIIQIEWIDSLMLFQSSYHKYDDTSRTQNYQMKREISVLQAENYSLERQLVSYQKSLASASSRGQYSDEVATPDSYAHNHVHPSAYDDRSLSETD